MKAINDVRQNGRWYIKEKMSNGQTLMLEFYLYNQTPTSRQWSIRLGIYSKRKHADFNEDNILTTGKNPWESIVTAKKAFLTLEKEVLDFYSHSDNIIFCVWTDTRRRDAYHHFLKKYGYDYGNIDNFKCIMKTYKKGETV